MKACARAGLRLQLRDQIEVNMLLQRVALMMLLQVGGVLGASQGVLVANVMPACS